ncbi:MAG TPA: hypothetical protein VLM40_00555 [Gemmata sp.]|nr:hypothetical protein [Gemmata sp.]
MTITLPEELRDVVERNAKAAGFATVAEYLSWLVQTDEAGDAVLSPEDFGFASTTEMEAALLASLNSGPTVEATPEFWAELRKRVADRADNRTQS